MGPAPISGDPQSNSDSRNVTLLPPNLKPAESNDVDAMDITPTATSNMGPPAHSSPDMDSHAITVANGDATQGPNSLSAIAATQSQQPKVVQTAFIHKLYNMLEDPSIQNLISWSNNNESFIMSPTPEFSKVLAQYFKHTNISSFVRQLNMYGFHKGGPSSNADADREPHLTPHAVSDVFHTSSPDSTLWEFKHGNGNFKRGDLAGLREIKRRASRHALIHRDSFPAPAHHKPSVSLPGTPADPIPAIDIGEARLGNLEHNLYDMHARLVRTEESNTALSAKCQTLSDSLAKCHQWSLELTHLVSSFVPDGEGSVKHDISVLERDIMQQLDLSRNAEDAHESLLSGKQPHFSNMALGEPLSPRQAPADERRQSFHATSARPPASRSYGPPPQNMPMPMPQRRYGSIGTANPTPNYHRPLQSQMQIPPTLPQHPLAHIHDSSGPNMGRRHTFADIRVPGWPGHTTASPITSADSSAQWPSSPTHISHQADQHLQEHLAAYTFGVPRRASHQTTPPMSSNENLSSTLSESNWSFGNSKAPSRHFDTASATRRSSVVSGVHSLLNPAETVERDEEDSVGDDRKRKRM